MQTQHTVMLYPLDKAGVNIMRRKLSESEGRQISETATIRALIQCGLAAYEITSEIMLKEINKPRKGQ